MSIFIFDPFLVFAGLFAVFRWRTINAPQRIVFLGSILVLLLLAAGLSVTYWWPGLSAWGPRHYLVPVQVVCLLGFAFALRDFAVGKPTVRAFVLANLALAIGVQLVALPLSAHVEYKQIADGDTLHVYPLMRIRNLFHIAKGDFERSGLAYGDPELVHAATEPSWEPIWALRFIVGRSAPEKALILLVWGSAVVTALVTWISTVVPALRRRRTVLAGT